MSASSSVKAQEILPISRTSLETKASALTQENSKKRCAQLGDKVLEFDEHEILGDGNCGFTSLGTTREEVSSMLLSLAGDEKARIELAGEIQGLLRENRESKLHTEETQKLFVELDTAQTDLDEQVRELNNQLAIEIKATETKTTLSASFQRQNLEGLIERLKDSSRPSHQTALTALRATHLRIFQIGEKIKSCCQSREVFECYVTQGLVRAEWLGYRSAKLFAKLKNYNLYVFYPSANRLGWLELAERQECTTPENTFYLLHTDRFTHYNLLSIVLAPALPLTSDSKSTTPTQKHITPSELKIDFSKLRKTASTIDHAEVKKIANAMLDACETRVGEFNKDVQNPLMAENLVQELTELETVVINAEAAVKRPGGNRTSLLRAEAILDDVKKACIAAKAQLVPSSIPITKTESHWEEHRLRFEQEILLGGSPLAEFFRKALEKIAKKGWPGHNLPTGIFIFYARPDEESERWIEPFLVGLREHLQKAGFSKTKLDIKDGVIGELKYNYLNEIEKNDFVLLIGTPGLLREYKRGSSEVHAALNYIQRKREKDKKEERQPTVLPLLIRGSRRSSFPAVDESYQIQDLTDTKNYFMHLCALIDQLYGTTEDAFKDIWQKFLADAKEQQPGVELVLRDRLTPEYVRGRLAKEQAENKNKEVTEHILLAASGISASSDYGASYSAERSDDKSASRKVGVDFLTALADYYTNETNSQVKHFSGINQPIKNWCRLSIQPNSTRAKNIKYILSHADLNQADPYEELYEASTVDSIDIANLFDFSGDQREQKRPDEVVQSQDRILITGSPGSGKSTLLQFIANQTANGNKLWNKKFDGVIWIKLRDLNGLIQPGDTLDKVLKVCFGNLLDLPQMNYEHLVASLSELKILFLIDGFDEWQYCQNSFMEKLFSKGSKQRKWTTLMTSRPFPGPPYKFDMRLEIVGLSNEDIERFVSNYFTEKDAAEPLKFLRASPFIYETVRIPLKLSIFCATFNSLRIQQKEEKRQTPRPIKLNQSSLYHELVKLLLTQHLMERPGVKQKRNLDITLPELSSEPVYQTFERELLVLEIIAYEAWLKQTLSLSLTWMKTLVDDIYKTYPALLGREPKILLPQDILHFGILESNNISMQQEGQAPSSNYYFAHTTLQEYFVALRSARMLMGKKSPSTSIKSTVLSFFWQQDGSLADIEKFIIGNCTKPSYLNVMRYIGGILNGKNVIAALNDFCGLLIKGNRTPSIRHLILWINCLGEVYTSEDVLEKSNVKGMVESCAKSMDSLLYHDKERTKVNKEQADIIMKALYKDINLIRLPSIWLVLERYFQYDWRHVRIFIKHKPKELWLIVKLDFEQRFHLQYYSEPSYQLLSEFSIYYPQDVIDILLKYIRANNKIDVRSVVPLIQELYQKNRHKMLEIIFRLAVNKDHEKYLRADLFKIVQEDIRYQPYKKPFSYKKYLVEEIINFCFAMYDDYLEEIRLCAENIMVLLAKNGYVQTTIIFLMEKLKLNEEKIINDSMKMLDHICSEIGSSAIESVIKNLTHVGKNEKILLIYFLRKHLAHSPGLLSALSNVTELSDGVNFGIFATCALRRHASFEEKKEKSISPVLSSIDMDTISKQAINNLESTDCLTRMVAQQTLQELIAVRPNLITNLILGKIITSPSLLTSANLQVINNCVAQSPSLFVETLAKLIASQRSFSMSAVIAITSGLMKTPLHHKEIVNQLIIPMLERGYYGADMWQLLNLLGEESYGQIYELILPPLINSRENIGGFDEMIQKVIDQFPEQTFKLLSSSNGFDPVFPKLTMRRIRLLKMITKSRPQLVFEFIEKPILLLFEEATKRMYSHNDPDGHGKNWDMVDIFHSIGNFLKLFVNSHVDYVTKYIEKLLSHDDFDAFATAIHLLENLVPGHLKEFFRLLPQTLNNDNLGKGSLAQSLSAVLKQIASTYPIEVIDFLKQLYLRRKITDFYGLINRIPQQYIQEKIDILLLIASNKNVYFIWSDRFETVYNVQNRTILLKRLSADINQEDSTVRKPAIKILSHIDCATLLVPDILKKITKDEACELFDKTSFSSIVESCQTTKAPEVYFPLIIARIKKDNIKCKVINETTIIFYTKLKQPLMMQLYPGQVAQFLEQLKTGKSISVSGVSGTENFTKDVEDDNPDAAGLGL